MPLGFANLTWGTNLGRAGLGSSGVAGSPAFSLSDLQNDSNVVLVQDPSAIWGGADMLASGATETQKYQHAATKNVPWLRRNMVTSSEDLTTAAWVRTGVTVTTAGITPPAGYSLANKVTHTGASGEVWSAPAKRFTFPSETTIYARFALKYFDVQWVRPMVGVNPGHNIAIWCDLQNGVLGANLAYAGSVSAGSATLTALGDGWYQLDVSALFSTAAAANGFVQVNTATGDGSNTRVAGSFLATGMCASPSPITSYQSIGTSWPATYTALAQAAGYPIALYSDRAGTTAVDTPDTVVGVQLDLSEGLVLGPELVTNGTFQTDITGWTANLGTAAWDAGTLKVIGQGGTFGRVVNSVTTVAGRGYLFSGSCTASSTVEATFLRVTTSSDGGSGGQLLVHTGDATWDKSGVFVATGATTYIAAVTGNLNTTANFDNISVREILGNHAIAPSDAARPLLKKDGNGKWYLLRDGVDDDLPITFPNLGSNCVTYVCDGTQVVKTTGVTLNGAHNTTTPTNDYGRIYCASPPTAAREAQIIKYLKAKAGIA